eukprot:NODE_341_length_2417_cov_21.417230_g316_i0.p1 GENE.NODE_341_length_2417_cov_21.417230_g316_i0~~NODE_341_length_2417_cov_21.417230_g316_i0.p1  ORF type:complete len:684 (+),score=123.45 NODE_341_length_2417_cov_21.417230_g316_i0:147-2198(+)
MRTEDVVLLVAAALTLLVSLWGLSHQLAHYYWAELQRHQVRMLTVIPMASIVSILSLCASDTVPYASFCLTVAEGIGLCSWCAFHFVIWRDLSVGQSQLMRQGSWAFAENFFPSWWSLLLMESFVLRPLLDMSDFVLRFAIGAESLPSAYFIMNESAFLVSTLSGLITACALIRSAPRSLRSSTGLGACSLPVFIGLRTLQDALAPIVFREYDWSFRDVSGRQGAEHLSGILLCLEIPCFGILFARAYGCTTRGRLAIQNSSFLEAIRSACDVRDGLGLGKGYGLLETRTRSESQERSRLLSSVVPKWSIADRGMEECGSDSDEGTDSEKLDRIRFLKQELVETEIKFVLGLELFFEHYFPLLQQVDPSRVESLFAALSVIREQNVALLSSFRTACDAARTHRGQLDYSTVAMGEILLRHFPLMHRYSAYVNSYEEISSYITQAFANHTEFAAASRAVQRRIQQQAGTLDCSLLAILISPVQRLVRYRILLDDMVEAVHDKSERSQLEIASKEIACIASFCNEMKKQSESAAAMVRIEHRHRIRELCQPFRTFLRECDGQVRKIKRNGKNTTRCHLYLFNDLLLCVKRWKQLTPGRVIWLSLDKVSSVSAVGGCGSGDEDERQALTSSTSGSAELHNEFVISERSYVLRLVCRSSESRDEWVTAIQSALDQLRMSCDDVLRDV